jgi:hypothetical protein
MSNKPIYHYVYRITNTIERKHYYGKRSCRIEPKLDLGKKYFSSSTDKDFRKDQKENPQHYKYKIIRCFESSTEAIEFEIRLHEKFDVGVNESFYNRAKQNVSSFDITGVRKTEEQKMKIQGINSCMSIPIDIYNYFTNELIAENVIASIWGKENGYVGIGRTLKSDPTIMHCTVSKSPNYNYCHVKGIYAVLHGDEPKKFSKEHIAYTKIGGSSYRHGLAKPIDIYDYLTSDLVAENVITKVWCEENGYSRDALSMTLLSDLDKPHNATKKSIDYNPHHVKGIYAVLHGQSPKEFKKEHIEYASIRISRPIDVYNYYTNELIAENVSCYSWCKENGYDAGRLKKTIYSNKEKPHNAYIKSPNFNLLHTKGIYARIHNPK